MDRWGGWSWAGALAVMAAAVALVSGSGPVNRLACRTAGRAFRRARLLAERTPPGRERYVDFLRALAITAVVAGHWLAIQVTYGGGRGFQGGSVLDVLPWTRPLTWLFQVMPVFFLIGGFANAVSLGSQHERGGGATGWVLRRTDRLVRPTTALLASLSVAALVARGLGADPGLIGTAVWLASIPLWFLVAYFAAVFLTPLLHAAHRRAGLAVPIVLAALVGAGDLARLTGFGPGLAVGSYLFAWLAIHQLGFAWQDGRLPARRGVALPLAGVSLIVLVVLTVAGPYPVSMVGVAGETLQNTSPPTLALLAFATAQTGIVLACHDRVSRWLRRPAVWTGVVAVNSVIMTVFLWHMTAAVLGALALYPTGIMPAVSAGSPEWLLLRLPWLAVLALILAILVAMFGPVERRTGRRAGKRAGKRAGSGIGQAVLTVAGAGGVLAGLLGVALAGQGDHGPAGMPTPALLTYFAGAAALRLARWRLSSAG
ncbi:acyltransferase family protein [Streptosporangium sp. KLBMP 9127]|nr:acyltransferase [Streptosporangium sp. KLBMP 9127]MCG5220794.1 acyltransferase [Streptosporangium sp. KLBMP 9127]